MIEPPLFPYTEPELKQIIVQLEKDREQCTTASEAKEVDEQLNHYKELLQETIIINNSI